MDRRGPMSKIQVVYQSRGGNTKKVAEAIAEVLGVGPIHVDKAEKEDADILFIGSAVYAASLDKQMKDYLAKLEGAKIGKAVLFGTSAGGKKPFGMLKKRLLKLGIPVDERTCYIPGEFLFMNKGRPNETDLAKAGEFAKGFLD